MFQKIIEWFREVVQRMIGRQTIQQALKVDIALSHKMSQALELWTQIYENESPWLVGDVIGLQGLGAAIAGEIARAATIELEVEFSESPRAKYLEEQFKKVLRKLRHQIEFGCAKGGLVLKPYISGSEISVDFVQADQFFPIQFDADGVVVSAIFVDQQQIGSSYFTRLEFHQMLGENKCEIVNQAFRSDNPNTLGEKVSLDVVEDWKDIQPSATVENIERPLFAYFRYPLANNIDSNSPLGVSCYSRATDLIRTADEMWSNFIWELDSAQRALYVDELALKPYEDGTFKLPNKRLYRMLDMGGAEDALFKDWSPTIRQKDILESLDAVMKKIEFVCGLAYGTLSNPTNIEKTATEIKISRQRTYSTIVDTQKELDEVFKHLLYAMDVWTTIGGLAPQGEYDVAFQFDDSIVVDTELQFQQDLLLVSRGLMSKLEFRMRNLRESEKMAQQALDKVTEEQEQTMEFEMANQVPGNIPLETKVSARDKKSEERRVKE